MKSAMAGINKQTDALPLRYIAEEQGFLYRSLPTEIESPTYYKHHVQIVHQS